MAAQMRHDYPVTGRCQQRGDIDEAVNIVGPAVQKNDRRTVGGTGFRVSDIQDAGIDLLERGERRVRTRFDCFRGSILPDWALAGPVVMPSWTAATDMAAMPKKRRR